MAGTDGPERYHQLLRSTGLDARQVLSGALAPFEAPRPALRSLAQYLAQPEQLHQQLREEQPDATTPRLQRAYLSVLQQDLALQVIAPLTLRLFRDGPGAAAGAGPDLPGAPTAGSRHPTDASPLVSGSGSAHGDSGHLRSGNGETVGGVVRRLSAPVGHQPGCLLEQHGPGAGRPLFGGMESG